MKYTIKPVTYENLDFQNLCKKLDDFQNEIIPERNELKLNALHGLENLEKIYLIYDKNYAVASGGLKKVTEEIAELARMYTDDNYRGQGLAKQIIEEVINYARQKGYKKIILDTWKDSISARKLYTSLGFKECPPFNQNAFKNSFSVLDKSIQEKIQNKLVFMELDI